METKHRELLKEFEAKQREVAALAAKADFGVADVERGNVLKDEMKSLKDQINVFVQKAALRGAAEDELKYLSEPVNRLPVAEGNNVGVLSSTAAGTATFGTKAGSDEYKMLADIGPGVFGPSTWEAVNTEDYRRAFVKMLRKGYGALKEAEYKTLSEGLDGQGGYLVPPTRLPGLIQRKPTPTRLLGRVNRQQSSTDMAQIASLQYASNSNDDPNGYIYTTNIRATSTGELPPDGVADVNDTNMYGLKTIQVYTWMLTGTVSKNQVEDSAFDVMGDIEMRYGQTVDLLKDNLILNGNGTGQSTGILFNAGNSDPNQPPTLLSTVSGGLAGDDLINVAEDVPEQYDENCAWIFNKTNTHKYIRKLKDSNNRYLFGFGYQDSGLAYRKPTDLVGYEYLWTQFAPNIGASNFPIVFGDLSGYYHVDRIGFSLQVLYEYYSRKNMLGLVGKVRFGGRVLEPWKLRVMKSNNS